jgi:hypothetical protein
MLKLEIFKKSLSTLFKKIASPIYFFLAIFSHFYENTFLVSFFIVKCVQDSLQ